jgi:hypothetical protein
MARKNGRKATPQRRKALHMDALARSAHQHQAVDSHPVNLADYRAAKARTAELRSWVTAGMPGLHLGGDSA